jgi:sulfur carrier protein
MYKFVLPETSYDELEALTRDAEDLVEKLGLQGRRIAMEVNEEIVPRSSYETYQFKENDKVEIIHAVGGG